jgi:hypothetical protein
MKGDAEEGPELPVEVVLRERRDLAQSFEVQVAIEMALDMVEHPLHPRVVVVQVGHLGRYALAASG